MSRPLVGICAAYRQARFGVWDQDAAMAPAALVAAAHELGWLAVLLAVDDAPEEALARLDGLVVPDFREHGDSYAELSERLGAEAEARGLPVVRPRESPEATTADYRDAIAGLFGDGSGAAQG